MQPTLEIQDRIVVNKLAYGIQNPLFALHEEPFIFELGFIKIPNPLVGVHWAFFDVKYLWKYGGGPKRMDIVVFRHPSWPLPPPKDLIKRVIGMPGETIQFDNGTVIINHVPILDVEARYHDQFSHPPIRIPEGYYWMMGDNRPNSLDSRFVGPLPADRLVGPAILRIWPLTRAGKP